MNTCDHYSYVKTKAYVASVNNVFATMCLRSLRLKAGSHNPIFGSDFCSNSKKLLTCMNRHFYELKQCQRKNWIQKSDRVNQHLYGDPALLLPPIIVNIFFLRFKLTSVSTSSYRSFKGDCPTNSGKTIIPDYNFVTLQCELS